MYRRPLPYSILLVLIDSPVIWVRVEVCRLEPVKESGCGSEWIEYYRIMQQLTLRHAWKRVLEPKAPHGIEVALQQHANGTLTSLHDGL